MRSLIGIILLSFALNSELVAQVNILGKPGLIRIPSARKITGRESINFSFGYLPKTYSINNFMFQSADELFYASQIQPTDWLSINFVLTRLIDVPRIGIGDRHLDFQFFILNEENHLINLSAIISPSTNASFIEHNALIMGRNVKFSPSFSLDLTGGYALKYSYRKPFANFNFSDTGYQWIDKSIFGNEYLYGFFYGLQLNYRDVLYLSSEYDSEYYNFSLSTLLFNKLNIHIALLDFQVPTAFFSYRVFLDKSRIKTKER